mmetsp:Transcript_9845/g.25393  ORF Transcript_9845/g.25393 Transcript_9845/m.25393 type:complete len:310 (-) Transcript_9845:201-1130(-)
MRIGMVQSFVHRAAVTDLMANRPADLQYSSQPQKALCPTPSLAHVAAAGRCPAACRASASVPSPLPVLVPEAVPVPVLSSVPIGAPSESSMGRVRERLRDRTVGMVAPRSQLRVRERRCVKASAAPKPPPPSSASPSCAGELGKIDSVRRRRIPLARRGEPPCPSMPPCRRSLRVMMPTTLGHGSTTSRWRRPIRRKRPETRRSDVLRSVTRAASLMYGRRLTTLTRSAAESALETSSMVVCVHGRKKSSAVSGGACEVGPACLERLEARCGGEATGRVSNCRLERMAMIWSRRMTPRTPPPPPARVTG